MCLLGRTRSTRPSPPASSSPAPELDAAPFRLLDLPSELVLQVIGHAAYRLATELFPEGPSSELIALSQTSTLFSEFCRPHVWRAISYAPIKRDLVRPADFRQKRNLRALRALQQIRAIPIEFLQATHPSGARGDDEEDVEAEQEAFVEIIEHLTRTGLKVLFLEKVHLAGPAKLLGDRLVRAIASSESLTAVRFNQVEAGKAKVYENLQPMPNLKTLQIMHGARSLLEFTRLGTHLESLLIWPERRQFGTLMPVIVGLLPTLRFLSMDAVAEPTCLDELTAELERRKAADEPTPLQELFLEGAQTSRDRSALINALSATSLKRLALYHLLTAHPSLIAEIATALPGLEGLTLVKGDTAEAVLWPSPLSNYTAQLHKLKQLQFFAFDRCSPRPAGAPNRTMDAGGVVTDQLQMQLEYDALSEVGLACDQLKTAVAILLDVSQGAVGFFAHFSRTEGKRSMMLKKATVQDFLVAFNRWCVW